MEFLKDAVAAMNDRVRSPFFGSMLLVFVGANWQALSYLVFGELALLERFNYFDANTSILSLVVVPVVVGVSLAIALPWVRLAGAFFASAPKRRLNSLEGEEAMLKRISHTEIEAKEQRALAELEEAEEQRKIAAAKRLEQAKAVSEETSKELERDRDQKSGGGAQPITNKRFQNDIRGEILVGLSLADDGKGILKHDYNNSGEPIAEKFVFVGMVDDSWISFKNDRRKRLLVEATLEELTKSGYIAHHDVTQDGDPILEISLKGYEAAEYIKSKYLPEDLETEHTND